MHLNRQLVRQKTGKTINGLLYSERPNITGRITYSAANDPRASSYDGASALYYAYPDQAVKTQYDYSTENKIPADPAIDASRVSSLYQNDLTEVRVNALFGLNLIRAF